MALAELHTETELHEEEAKHRMDEGKLYGFSSMALAELHTEAELHEEKEGGENEAWTAASTPCFRSAAMAKHGMGEGKLYGFSSMALAELHTEAELHEEEEGGETEAWTAVSTPCFSSAAMAKHRMDEGKL